MALSVIWLLVLPALGAVAWLLWWCGGDGAGSSTKVTIRASRTVQLAVITEPNRRGRPGAPCSRAVGPR